MYAFNKLSGTKLPLREFNRLYEKGVKAGVERASHAGNVQWIKHYMPVVTPVVSRPRTNSFSDAMELAMDPLLTPSSNSITI